MMSESAISVPPPPQADADGIATLQIVDPTAYAGWDALLEPHPAATFFHTAAWARTLVAAYGFQCRYVVAIQHGQLMGLLPMMEADSFLRGKRGVSLPFTDESPALVSSGRQADSLFERATEEGVQEGWKHLELRGGEHLVAGAPGAVSFAGHSLVLDTEDKVLERFESSVRRAVRKAERSGVTVEFEQDLDSLRAYYQLHCRIRTQKHGAPPQPFKFFAAIYHNIFQEGKGFVALARRNGKPVAGAVFFTFGPKAIYKFSASDDRQQEFRGANLVLWRSLQHLLRSGATELNFGKTSLSNEGLRRFKRSWGATEYLIRYARYSLPKRQFVQMTDLASGVQARIFARLPVFLSRWIGRAVYSHLS